MSASGWESRLIKIWRLTAIWMRSRNGRFSSNLPPRTPGRASTIYSLRSMSSPVIGLSPFSLSQNFLHSFDDIGRLLNHLFGQSFELFTAHRIDLPLPFFCLSQEVRIFEHLVVRFAKNLQPIARN